jgi:hypothetical protein
VKPLRKLCDFLVAEDCLVPCDLIVVLAGLPERKSYGLELFSRGLAPRLILSVARFDVRHTGQLLQGDQELISLRDKVQPEKRHFWVDQDFDRTTILRADLRRSGTFGELQGLAFYLAPSSPGKIAFVSTSIHLRRIRFCCSQIPFFYNRTVCLWAVSEEASSFRRNGWWKRCGDSRYLISEYAKLVGYQLLYKGTRDG